MCVLTLEICIDVCVITQRVIFIRAEEEAAVCRFRTTNHDSYWYFSNEVEKRKDYLKIRKKEISLILK